MRSRRRTITTILLAALAITAIVQRDGWRPAVLAGAAAAAVLATRIRYAAVVAIGVLAAVAGFALAGRGVVLDARAGTQARPAAATDRHHAHRRHHHHHHRRTPPHARRHATKDKE
jgi:ABC-type nickel/cobalt efflux system permease component RcnA